MTNYQPDWISWPAAAALVGCPVPTIDWYTRQGRIEKRPFKGSRPSLNRKSVEEFAAWWQCREEGRRAAAAAKQRTARRAPPRPPDHLTTAEAAEALGVKPGHVCYLVAHGPLRAERRGQQLWLSGEAVAQLAAERARWISLATAAQLADCSVHAITTAIRRGEIEQRQTGQQHPSLNRNSVERWAQRRRVSTATQRSRAEERERRRRLHGRPDDEHRWLSEQEAAERLGITRERAGQLAREDRLPSTRVGRRRWYRADHIERIVSARAFRRKSEVWLDEI